MPTPTEPLAPLLVWADPIPRPGWTNMAVDRALLGLAAEEGVAILRLYRWEPSCLSFGRHEPAARRYDRARIEALGLDCVRRPTGGRAVWHAGELTYAVVAPEVRLGGLREAYARIHAWLALAVTRLGAPARLAGPPGRTPRPGDGACFDAPVGGEVVVGGRKVVGSAQVREGGALLQHGSMLLRDDQSLVRTVSLAPDDRPATEQPLAALLGRAVPWEAAAAAVALAAAVPWEAAAAAVALAARERWEGPVEDADLASRVLPLAGRWTGQFRDPAWTWGR